MIDPTRPLPFDWTTAAFDATAAMMIAALMPGVFWGMLGSKLPPATQAAARAAVE